MFVIYEDYNAENDIKCASTLEEAKGIAKEMSDKIYCEEDDGTGEFHIVVVIAEVHPVTAFHSVGTFSEEEYFTDVKEGD